MSIFCQNSQRPLCQNDNAVEILSSIFGNRFIEAFLSGGSPGNVTAEVGVMAPALLGGLVSVVFSLSIVLASALLLTSILNSAQDGEAFGRGSSKATIVMRFLFSWIMLLPTASGYSIIQVLLMAIVLWSNGATNKLYETSIISALQSNASLTANQVSDDIWQVRKVGIESLRQIHCLSVLNYEIYGKQPYTNAWASTAISGNGDTQYPVAGWVQNFPDPNSVTTRQTRVDLTPAFGYDFKTANVNQNNSYTKATFDYVVSDGGKQISDVSTPLCGKRTVNLVRYDSIIDSMIKSKNAYVPPTENTTTNNTQFRLLGINSDADQQQALRLIASINQNMQNRKFYLQRAVMREMEAWYVNQHVNVDATRNNGANPYENVDARQLNNIFEKYIDLSHQRASEVFTGSGSGYPDAVAKLTNYLLGRGWTHASEVRQKVLGFQNEVQKAQQSEITTFYAPTIPHSISDAGAKGKAILNSIGASDKFLSNMVITEINKGNVKLDDIASTINPNLDAGGVVSSIFSIENATKNYVNRTQQTLVYMILHGAEAPSSQSIARFNTSANPMARFDNRTDVLHNIQDAGEWMMAQPVLLEGSRIAVQTVIATARVGGGWIPLVGESVENPLNAIRDWYMSVLEPILSKLIIIFGLLGVYMAIVIPSMPTFFFTTAVVAWFINIIQAMAGLPLWALMHMIPERTFAGSQTQGYVTVIALFLRPLLTLLGLWFGYILANPLLFYVTDAFWGAQAVLQDGAASNSISAVFFGFVTFSAWIAAYCTLILSICYMIFGLAATIPNTILEWLGSSLNAGNWGESDAKSAVAGTSGAHTAYEGAGAKVKRERSEATAARNREVREAGGNPDTRTQATRFGETLAGGIDRVTGLDQVSANSTSPGAAGNSRSATNNATAGSGVSANSTSQGQSSGNNTSSANGTTSNRRGSRQDSASANSTTTSGSTNNSTTGTPGIERVGRNTGGPSSRDMTQNVTGRNSNSGNNRSQSTRSASPSTRGVNSSSRRNNRRTGLRPNSPNKPNNPNNKK